MRYGALSHNLQSLHFGEIFIFTHFLMEKMDIGIFPGVLSKKCQHTLICMCTNVLPTAEVKMASFSATLGKSLQICMEL